MMRSLYSGVSGLKNHQARMDVIGNNISNVNTTAYKSSRVIFQDIYSQTLKAASAGTATLGGTNPAQIGLGVSLGAIDILFNSAAMQRTDNPSDLAIEGEGFFVVDTNGTDAGGMFYTRAGNFYVDNAGYLVTSDGYFIMGYDPTATPAESALEQINLAGYTGITFDDTGMVWGMDSTDTKVAIAKVALAVFTNNGGLEKMGSNLYSETGSSGAPTFTASQQGGAGKINTGGLEMSNVDLASEFTDMIITQRGFQANSRIITTADSLLEELVNLKR
jgi:flagellar hook protein FlgE